MGIEGRPGAGMGGPTRREYLDADIDGKREVALDINSKFVVMGSGSRESKEPRNPYNRRLVGAWADYLLTMHYDVLGQRNLGDVDIQ